MHRPDFSKVKSKITCTEITSAQLLLKVTWIYDNLAQWILKQQEQTRFQGSKFWNNLQRPDLGTVNCKVTWTGVTAT